MSPDDQDDRDTRPGEDNPEDDLQRISQNYSTQILVGTIAVVLGLGTVVYRWLEGWSWVDSLYFSVVTLTTVGYGDLSPTTDASKLFTVAYLAAGISLLGASFNEIMKRRQRHRRARREADR